MRTGKTVAASFNTSAIYSVVRIISAYRGLHLKCLKRRPLSNHWSTFYKTEEARVAFLTNPSLQMCFIKLWKTVINGLRFGPPCMWSVVAYIRWLVHSCLLAVISVSKLPVMYKVARESKPSSFWHICVIFWPIFKNLSLPLLALNLLDTAQYYLVKY